MEKPYDIVEYQGIGGKMHVEMKEPTKEECDIQFDCVDGTVKPYDIEIRGTTKDDMYLVVKEKTMEDCYIYIDDQLERYKKMNKIEAPNGSYRTIKLKDMPIIDKVIFNPPATVVMWDDGTKTVVKASDESFSEEVGLCEAIAKRYFGNRSKLKKAIKDAKRPAESRTDAKASKKEEVGLCEAMDALLDAVKDAKETE